MTEVFVIVGAFALVLAGGLSIAYIQYRNIVREAKNYERGLKMVPLMIHLPPSTTNIDAGARDERDVTDEALSQAQTMYNIIASTSTKGFISKVYGQRHITFELIATKGTINFYVVVPYAMLDIVQQAIVAAYPSARLEEVEEHNLFNKAGRLSATIGGEFTLRKHFAYPIATYQDTKRDAMRALLNSLSAAGREDGIGIQILVRPASESWTKKVISKVGEIKKNKGSHKSGSDIAIKPGELLEALWKSPQSSEEKPKEQQLSNLDQMKIEKMEQKTQHPGYESLVRVITSSNSAARSQVLMKNVVSSFAMFDSPSSNGFKFAVARDMEQFVTSFIFRFFPQSIRSNVLNSVELATIFHLPDQREVATSQVQRQSVKQVDGPRQVSDEGILLGYNEFRGVKKEIRLGTADRRRHLYMIGQTGTGKSGFLVNAAMQDMYEGRGFAFIDPHGDSAEALMGMVPKERVEDVIYFNPGDMDSPIGLNLFEFDTPDQRDFLVQEAIAMLYRLYDPGHTGIIGPRYEHWFRNAALTIMSDPNGTSFIDIPQVFNDNEFAKEKLKYVTDQTVLDFWNKEMAQTSDYHKSEVLGWFVSKFGAFLSNEMMRNIIGQTKSGFNLRDIMDNKKILLVNLSKGKTGELNSQLLGMIFVMKFQAAAMGRANVPEDQRTDFSLYVDEFQNFATDSFESILSEARKYRLNLILANQFMTQLTDKIREAIIGNVGTIISGRIGTTDAELMVKRFSPTFDTEDLTRLPNFQTITSVMINGVPSQPFSMALISPQGEVVPKLAEALKKLSAAKYGQPRSEVEKQIFKRLRSGDEAREKRQMELRGMHNSVAATSENTGRTNTSYQQTSGSSFLDEWLEKRKKQIPSRSSPPKEVPPESHKTNDNEGIVNQAPSSKTVTDGHDQRLRKLQTEGVGSSVTIQPANANGTVASATLSSDVVDLESALDSTENEIKKRVVNEDGEVNVRHTKKQADSGTAHDEAGDVDEIFIDIRGTLHHKTDDAPGTDSLSE